MPIEGLEHIGVRYKNEIKIGLWEFPYSAPTFTPSSAPAPTPACAFAAAPCYPCGPAPPDRESIHITGWS